VVHQLPIVETGVGNAAGAGASAQVLSLQWPDESATQVFAQALARQPELADAFVTLQGDLGAGKTTLARHLLQALGVSGRIKSPTYAIVEAYELPALAIWHCDFYRFNDPQEWEDAGFRDIFASPGLKLAEWPQKAEDLLPVADLDIAIRTDSETARQVTLRSTTPRGAALLQAMAQAFHAGAGPSA
jgi:tRNA threonylcarbamoyladenosine biosynthesis protein TsaE